MEKCHPSPWIFYSPPLVWSFSFRENQVLGTLLDCAAGPVSSGCPLPPAGHQAGSKFSATAYRRPMWGWFIHVYTSHKWVSEIDNLLGLPHHSTTYPIRVWLKKSWLIIIFPINTAILNRQTAIFGRTNILPVISHGSWYFCAKLQSFMTMPSLFQGVLLNFFTLFMDYIYIYVCTQYVLCVYIYIYEFCFVHLTFPHIWNVFFIFFWPSQRPSDCDHGSRLGASQ